MTTIHDNNPYMRPVNKHSWCQKVGLALYNKDNKTILGRTAKGWGLLLMFYTIFYAVLAAFFALYMYAVMKTIPKDRPKYTMQESLIGLNPGMGFRPQFVDEGSIIWYNAQNDTQVARYVDALDEWLDEYKNQSYPGASHRVPCNFSWNLTDTQACTVDTSTFGPCSSENKYGYKSMKPCIFIKINRIYGWKPDYYTSSEQQPDMPDDLKRYIDNLPPNERSQVWISCKGENPADYDSLNFDTSIKSNVSYYPSRGVPWYYYPYKNQLGYINPIRAVQFSNIELGRIINIRCRAWAKNIIYSQSVREVSGSTHIELMIDNNPLT